jgi:uncharacterized protein YjbJ (UPF0337 family)
MNKEQVDGKLEQLKGGIKKTWAKLTDNDVLLFEGQKDKFYGKIKELHGDTREAAEKKMEELQKLNAQNDKAA